eukprot:9469648-Pyramimonas_sp.AAC.2
MPPAMFRVSVMCWRLHAYIICARGTSYPPKGGLVIDRRVVEGRGRQNKIPARWLTRAVG